jgi:hypothetical protein
MDELNVDTTRVADRLACEQLVAKYAHYIDFGTAGRVAELFSEDGVWEAGSNRMVGFEEIRQGFLTRQQQTTRTSRHVCTTFAVEFLDVDTAEGTVYLTLYRHDAAEPIRVAPVAGPLLVGEYRDVFVRTAQGWRIKHRRFSMAFLASDETNRRATDAGIKP